MEPKSIVLISGIILFGLLEQIFPFFKYQQSLNKRYFTNFILALINVLTLSWIILLLLKYVWQQTEWLGFLHYLNLSWLNLILSFLFLDYYMYVWHRLMHTLPWGWRLHLVHHTDCCMNILTAYRFHTLEVFLSNLPKVFLIYLLGISPTYLLVYELVFTISVLFHHSNLNLPVKIDKILSYLIVTPNYHRSHHSDNFQSIQSNYASILALWDFIFKSRYYPQFPKQIKLGIAQKKQNLDVINLLILPFQKITLR